MPTPSPSLQLPDSVRHLDPDLVVPFAALQARLPALQRGYQAAKPFRHVHLRGLLRPDVAAEAAAVFPGPESPAWTHYRHYNERKLGTPKLEAMPPPIRGVLDGLRSDAFVQWLVDLTGETGLFADPHLEGAGMHLSQRGGFLNVHTDFQRHHIHPRWRRTVNLILYLNPDWALEWGGGIELWSADMQRREVVVPPLLNHAVIFRSDERSFHGHPEPLRCPPDRCRQSLALYYYVDTDQPPAHEYSRFMARPSDGLRRRLPMRLDNDLVRAFSWFKRRGAASDRFASRWLRRVAGWTGTLSPPADPD